MNFGDIVGELMRGGVSPVTNQRLQHSVSENGLGGLGDMLGGVLGGGQSSGGGLGDMLGGVLGGGQSGGTGGIGDILGQIGGALSADSGVGGLSRGQVGGIGAIAGALLGGGGGAAKGAVGGGAMAILGTLAMSALKNWQAQQAAGGGASAAPPVSEQELRQIAAPETAELCLRGMIEAAKSDGEVSQDEIERLVGKLEEGGITPEEQAFVREQLQRPGDLSDLISRIPNREVGAQVYAASLMAISVDTRAEQEFLSQLASAIGIDHGALQRLHMMVGAPAPVA